MKKEVVMVAILLSFAALSLHAQQQGTIPEPGSTFQRLDTNDDGVVDENEARADPELVGSFSLYDLDGDGQISAEEVERFDERAKQ